MGKREVYTSLGRMYQLGILAAITILLLFPTISMADMYMVRDSRGIIYFTDTPPSGKTKVIKTYQSQKPASTSTRRSSRFATNGYVASYGSPVSSRYDSYITSAADRYNLDPILIKAIIQVESNFNRFSISSKGARGLMQLMPQTARLMKVKSIFDPAQNIGGGSRYLRKMMDMFGGDIRLALAAYNAGPTAVRKYGGIPPYKETIRYVGKVFTAYRKIARRPLRDSGPSLASSHRKTVVYMVKNGDGSVTMTDLPVGERRVIND